MNKQKERKKREARYVTESDKKNHFNEVIDSSVKIINRQFKKISRCAKGRTYSYTPEQVLKLSTYLLEQVDKINKRLNRTIEQEKEFSIGAKD